MIGSVIRTSLSGLPKDQLSQMETTCGSLLYELQIIWDEVGESDMERDNMLLELERECLEVYRRKVDQANKLRAKLRRAIAESEAELASICSAMGDPPVHVRQSNQKVNSLKEELKSILPQLEEMRKKKIERKKQFVEVLEQIQKISAEIGSREPSSSKIDADESSLSIKRFKELCGQLESLQKEKAVRLKQVIDHLDTLNSLCSVLGLDFKQTVSEIHPTLGNSEGSKSINNATIGRLEVAVKSLRDVKLARMQQLQDLATSMLELWDLMDTPVEEQQLFQSVTRNIAASEQEITEPNTLSLDFIKHVEVEVSRLEELKSTKMKELVMKKKSELEGLRRRTHIIADSNTETEIPIEVLESGAIDPSLVLDQIEDQISNVKEEAFRRKDILEKVEKWLAACSEESWLEEYNRDDNRYSAGKGAHLALKRAEKARATVSKLPAMVEALVGKTAAWEKERGIAFIYDGVQLLSMLEEYTILRQEKEQEQRKQRDQKKLQGQLMAEQEAIFGSRPSPSKHQTAKKVPRASIGGPGGNRRLSQLREPIFGGAMLYPSSKQDFLLSAKVTRSTRKADEEASLSSGRRGLDVAGLPVKKLSFNGMSSSSAREVEATTTTTRTPFAPLTADNPKALMAPPSSKHNMPSSITSTPSKDSKPVSVADEENRTPMMVPAVQAPKTPKTVSIPMSMSMTPAPQPHAIDFEQQQHPELPEEEEEEEIEYSYEERRAGFTLTRDINLEACV